MIEKLLLFIPFLMFILYTNVHFSFAIKTTSNLIFSILKLFNALYMKGPYIFFIISLTLAVYIFINGNKKQKIITVATMIGCFFMYYSLVKRGSNIDYLTTLLFVSSYLIGIFYTISFIIYLKDKKISDINKVIIKSAKACVIYIGIVFILAVLSNTSQYSYEAYEQGITAWFRSTNGLGHSLVFLLPLFVLFYVKDKKNKYLFYIIVISILDLVIGTKACYYGLLSTLFITILYLVIDFFKNKKYHYTKLLSLFIILLVSILISGNLYVTNNIKKNIEYNTNEQGNFDVVNYIISDRYDSVDEIKSFFRESDMLTKTFGLGIYYPRFDFIYIELDLFDLLYSRGLYGLLLYIIFFGAIVVEILKQSFKNIKKHFDIDILLMMLTLGYIVFASMFVGHVVFNLMPLTVAVLVVLYYMFIIKKQNEIPEKVEKNISKHRKKKKSK